jgi:hypothetical protein
MPDNSFSITYSGGVLWNQGTIGNTVMNTINARGGINISKKPTDPLVTTKEYTYSKLAYGNSYQIKTDWEGDVIAHKNVPLPENIFSVNQARAATNNSLAYIKGDYNGLVAETETGGIKYFLAVPSIIAGTGAIGSVLRIESNELSGVLLINGQSSQAGVVYNPKLVYSSGSLPSTIAEQQLFASGIALAYSGTILATQPNIQPFITALANNDFTTLASLGGGVVRRSL